MRRGNLFAIVSCLMGIGLLLAGCAPALAPTPSAKSPAASTTPIPSAPATESTAPKPAAPAATPKPAAEQPRYGGVSPIIHSADPGHLDLQRLRGPLHALVGPGYSGILKYDTQDTEKVVTDLAERWEVSSDGKVYTFHLRKDIRWHDGKPFTAADAKFNVERLTEKASPFAGMLLAVERAETPDANILNLFLKYPSASLPAQLANGFILLFPKHVIEAKGDMKKDYVGTGPFKLKAYNPYVSLELVKNENYFEKGLPYLDGVTFYLIRDRTTQIAAFRVGNAKMTSVGVPLEKPDADLMRKQAPNAVIHPMNRLTARVFYMNASMAPWNDVRVRRAVFLAWDRQAAIKVLGQGVGEIRATMLTGAFALPKEEVLKLPGFRQPKDADRAEARRLLAEAGFPEGFATRMLTRADYPEYIRLSEFAADQLKTIGISGTVDGQDGPVFTDRRFRVDYHSMAFGPNVENTDPDGAARFFASPNEPGFVDPEIDRLFAQQSQTLDPLARQRLVREMELRLIDQAWYVTSHWNENYLFAWPEVKNSAPKWAGPPNNNRLIRDVWLAK
ncbi:MAG: ABC transporter substrate-binding protein [Chloroflexi bacterium]|nr:ABC transporter substrate-binding protein [Chloroflexota bacterium]